MINLILFFNIFIHGAENNNESIEGILKDDNRFQVLKDRYPYSDFSGLRMIAVSNDGALSAWQGYVGKLNEKFLHDEYVQIFLTAHKETDYYLRGKKMDWLEKTIIVNKTIFSEVNEKTHFEVDSLENDAWDIQNHEIPFYSHFCLNCKNNLVYFFREKGLVSKYSLAAFEELQSQKFAIPDSFVNDALLLDNNNLLCYVTLHGLYHFDWVASKARSMGKHYDRGFKKADDSHYMLAMFHKSPGGCWDYKRELRVLNLKKRNSKKRFFIEWSIPDKHRRIGQFNFLPNQDDYFIVSYSSSKKGCTIYSFKSRQKIARIYTPQISRFFFPTNDLIVLYFGDLQTKQLNFASLVAAYQKQNNNNASTPVIVGSKYGASF